MKYKIVILTPKGAVYHTFEIGEYIMDVLKEFNCSPFDWHGHSGETVSVIIDNALHMMKQTKLTPVFYRDDPIWDMFWLLEKKEVKPEVKRYAVYEFLEKVLFLRATLDENNYWYCEQDEHIIKYTDDSGYESSGIEIDTTYYFE